MDGRRERRIDLNGKDCAFFVNSKREDPLPLPFSTYIALYDPNMRAPLKKNCLLKVFWFKMHACIT
jgi:hypothetical protein